MKWKITHADNLNNKFTCQSENGDVHHIEIPEAHRERAAKLSFIKNACDDFESKLLQSSEEMAPEILKEHIPMWMIHLLAIETAIVLGLFVLAFMLKAKFF